MSTSKAARRPHGREEVVAALLDAATELFAARGPAAVSLRDVAQHAGVNLGLIHRHIGGKQELLTQVLARRPGMPPLDATGALATDELVDVVLGLIASDAAYTKIMMRATLDGYEVPRLPMAFPLVERSAASLRQTLPRRDAHVRVALLAAAAIGWQALSDMLLEVLDEQDLSSDEVADALRPALTAFLAAG
jgi:AcrR family transcriptional regulator